MDRHVLKGQAIFLAEVQPDTARNLQSALERFGAEVVPPQRAMEAIERREEFDFSLAILDWSPDSSEHSAVARRLKEEGARFLFCPKQPPEEVTARRAPHHGKDRRTQGDHQSPRAPCPRGATGASDAPGHGAHPTRTAIDWTSFTQLAWVEDMLAYLDPVRPER